MYKRKLLYTVAQDKEGKLVNAQDASKDDIFCCPVCKGKMTLKRSEAQKRRPHFAHKALTANCTPESALHFGFKSMLCEKINEKIENKIAWEMKWECEYCQETHLVDLLKKAKIARLETGLDECRPDITIFDENDNAIIAIEVVVTHFPEEKSLDYLRKNKIVLVRFDIENEQDLAIIENDQLAPSSVLCCLKHGRCENCGSFMEARTMGIALADCWKCHADMRMAYPDYNKDGMPDKDQLDFLESKGVKIRERSVNGIDGKQYLNICPRCNVVSGESFSYHYFHGQCEIEEYVTGYSCPVCKTMERLPKEKFYSIKRSLNKACHAESARSWERNGNFDEEE